MSRHRSLAGKRGLVRLSDFLFDEVLSRIRPLFLVFGWLLKAADLARQGLLMLANEYLKSRLGSCGRGVRLNGWMRITAPACVHLGENVHINANAFLRGEGGISIGDNCHISRNLVIYSVNHDYMGNALPYDENQIQKPVRVGNNVWIGMNVMIAPGVTIGEGAIVGMGTTVRHDVEPCAIVAGPRCEVLKYRDREHYERLCREGRFSGMAGIL